MALNAKLYSAAFIRYESSLPEDFRKSNGVFYTDIPLAEEMLLAVKPHIKTEHPTILDPCCGAGSFLFVAEKLGYTSLYGIDIDDNAVKFCRKNISRAHFAAADFIEQTAERSLALFQLAEKVDCVIGNPPYVPIAGNLSVVRHLFDRDVSDSINNLFVAALIRSLEILKDGGILSYIIPKNFLHVFSYSSLRRKILSEYIIVSIVDLGQCFKNVRGEQVVLTILKERTARENKIEIKEHKSGYFVTLCEVPQTFYSDEILLFDCNKDREIYERLTNTYKTLNDYCRGYIGRGKSTADTAVVGNDIRKFGYKSKPCPIGKGNQIFIQNIYSAEAGVIASYGGALSPSQTVTVITDGNPKMCRFILGILHSRLCNFFLYRYCYNRSHLTMHTDARYLKKIPLPSPDSEGYKQAFDRILALVSALESDEYLAPQWFISIEKLNKAVYDVYGMTPELSEYIDAEVRKFQSKKWIFNG